MGLFLAQEPGKQKDIIYPHFIYHQKNFRRIKIYCSITCSVKHWDLELKRVKRGDKDYKLKNLSIQSLQSKLQNIILRYKNNDELLSPPRLKSEMVRREKIKEATSYSTLPLINLVQEWETEYMSDKEIQKTTKSKTKSVVKDIKDFIVEVQSKQSNTLLIDGLDDGFCRDFMNWLFNKPTTKGIGLQPHSVSRRFQYLQSFCKWYSDISKEYKRVKIPRELSQSTRINDSKIPLCFFEGELQRIFEFTEFNCLEPLTKEDGTISWVESDKWEKYLTKDKQNREKKSGVLEFIYEETKYGEQTYTSWEVYKDFLIFLCSVGCRYSDGVKIKVGDIKHKKRSENSPIKGGIEAFFQFHQKKTNQIATPRVNEVSFDIFKKYSRGKTRDDYLFPRTSRGNSISDQKFNKHIKQICKTIGLNRRIVVRTLGSKGVEINKEDKYLWEVVSSHIGRKTYIKTMVLDKNFTPHEIMKMTGHKSDRVFHKYYSIEEHDLLKKPNSPFIKKQNNFLIQSNEDAEQIEVDLPPPPRNELTLKDKLIQLKELLDSNLITNEEFNKKRNVLLKSF